ncbi:MAG: hypothetical protein AAF602_33000 [Myxococcota bacterium]
MGRTRGTRNANYAERRANLAQAALQAFLGPGGQPASFRAIAQALGEDPRTLRHYFGNADGLYEATFETLEARSRHFRDEVYARRHEGPTAALTHFCQSLLTGWAYGMDHMFHVALAGGLENDVRGPVVVKHLLEPTLETVEDLLTHFIETGELELADPRMGALSFLPPLLLGLLHQDSLRGRDIRPLDLEAFVADHVRRFVAGCAPREGG